MRAFAKWFSRKGGLHISHTARTGTSVLKAWSPIYFTHMSFWRHAASALAANSQDLFKFLWNCILSLIPMDKPDTSHLFDTKMELHPEEESFAQPTIILKNSKPSNRCNSVRIAGIILVVALIAAAFIGGYLVRRAVSKSSKCETNGDALRPTSSPRLSVRLQDILADMSAENIELNLRLVYSSLVFLVVLNRHLSVKKNHLVVNRLMQFVRSDWVVVSISLWCLIACLISCFVIYMQAIIMISWLRWGRFSLIFLQHFNTENRLAIFYHPTDIGKWAIA